MVKKPHFYYSHSLQLFFTCQIMLINTNHHPKNKQLVSELKKTCEQQQHYHRSRYKQIS